MKSKLYHITIAGIIAAIYAALTMIFWQFSSLAIQVRVSEALCVLPFFFPAAVPGLFLGCLISNILSGTPFDIIFGSAATLIAAVFTAYMGKSYRKGKTNKLSISKRLLIPLPTVVSNTLIIPFVLYYGYGITQISGNNEKATVILLLALSIFIGEVIALYILGIPLIIWLEKHKEKLIKK